MLHECRCEFRNRPSYSDILSSRSQFRRYRRHCLQDYRQRAGPEALRHRVETCARFGDSLCHLHRRDYQKNRFRVRPALDLKDPIDCRVVEWIRAEPVRCVGGKSDNTAGPKQRSDFAVRFVLERFGVIHLHARIVLRLIQYNAPQMDIGKHSPKLIELRKAIQHGSLTDHGLLPIEGPNLLAEAQRSGIHIVDVFRRIGTEVPTVQSDTVFDVTADVFKTIQDTEHSQGVIATVQPRQYTLDDVLSASPGLVVILGRLQDPGNVGTILRIGESFGATGCIALHGTAGFYNSKVVRASAGSLFRLPYTGPADLHDVVGALRSRKITLVGTSPKGTPSIDEWNWRKPAAILLGNEGQGLSPDELAQCDTVMRIPHNAVVESLNSAIAAAVILYEASKQRNTR